MHIGGIPRTKPKDISKLRTSSSGFGDYQFNLVLSGRARLKSLATPGKKYNLFELASTFTCANEGNVMQVKTLSPLFQA